MHSEPPGVSKSCEGGCCLLWNSLRYILLIATQRTIMSVIVLLFHFFCILVYLCARWQFGWVWEVHLPVTSSWCGFSESWLKRNVHDVWNEGRRAILLLSVLLMDRYKVFGELQAHFFCILCPSFITDAEDNSLKLTLRSCMKSYTGRTYTLDSSFLRKDSFHRPLCGLLWMARSTWSRVCDG